MRSSGRVMIGTPAGHALQWQSDDRDPRPKNVACRCVGVALGRVQGEVRQGAAHDVVFLEGHLGEHDPAAGDLSSQSTPVGTRLRMLHHILKVSGSSLYI